MWKWWLRLQEKILWLNPKSLDWRFEHLEKRHDSLRATIEEVFENSWQVMKALDDTINRLDQRLDAIEHAILGETSHDALSNNILALRAPLLTERIDSEIKFLSSAYSSDEAIFNTSLMRYGDGFVVAARQSNAAFVNDSSSTPKSRDMHYSNIVLSYLTEDLSVERSVTVNDDAVRSRHREATFGFEDVRLFCWQGLICAICGAVGPGPGYSLTVTQCVIFIESDEVVSCWLLPSPMKRSIEKNWIPVIEAGRLFLIYSFSPLVILEVDAIKENVGNIRGDLRALGASVGIRGGTNLVKMGDKHHLCLVHLPSFKLEGKYVYIHKWAVLDAAYNIVETSEPFFLVRRGIEFAAGLVEYKDWLIVSLGVADRRSALIKLSKTQVLNSLITFRA